MSEPRDPASPVPEPAPEPIEGLEAGASSSHPDAGLAEQLAAGGTSHVADGQWHRMHPMTPLLKGGIVMLVVIGILVANMRDRIVGWFIDRFAPGGASYDYEGDPIEWLISNDMIVTGSLAALGGIVVLCVIFYIVWRFHTFRITEEHVEVRKGILFRSHRRAPLDRIQGVNLTRPFLARLIGLARLEVVGAGTDANVALEYLATARAEGLRADILRLASGARRAKAVARGQQRLVDAVSEGITGVLEGVDAADLASDSLVRIPAGRIVGSQLLAIGPWFLFAALMGTAVVVLPLIFGDGAGSVLAALGTALAIGIPMIIAFVAVTWSQISRSLRYAIAATSDGVRMTYGLLTTVTETLPPGRVHALEIAQPLLWRGFGWWTVRINRMTGASVAQASRTSQQQFTIALPVGTLDDVARVIELLLPELPSADLPLIFHDGIAGPHEADPYRTMRRGAGWRRPVSWRRHGYALTDFALLLRRGRVWRKLAVFPLARLQSFSIEQGPIDRAQNVGSARAHTIMGPVSGIVAGVDRGPLQDLLNDVSARTAVAASRDTSHRWAEVLERVLAEQAAAREAPDAAASLPEGAPSAPEPVEGPEGTMATRVDELGDRPELDDRPGEGRP